MLKFKSLFFLSIFFACSQTLLFSITAPSSKPPVLAEKQTPLEKLKEGNQRFANNKPTNCMNIEEARKDAKTSHKPLAAVLSCSDARVGPETIFDQGVGDLFVVRVAGNILSDEGIGSLEYAVQFLDAPLVIIMGHTHCGALEAFLKTFQKGAFLNGYIESLVLSVYPATKYLKDLNTATVEDLVVANVRSVKKKLLESSPVIGQKEKAGMIQVVGAFYDLDSGLVTFLDDARR